MSSPGRTADEVSTVGRGAGGYGTILAEFATHHRFLAAKHHPRSASQASRKEGPHAKDRLLGEPVESA
jgi:hypothetical protein